MSASDERLRILEQIETGEIDVDDALRRLQEVDATIAGCVLFAARSRRRTTRNISSGG